MRTQTESFISEVILSPTYNATQSDGDVESPTGFFGYMSFDPNEFVIDGMDTPTEFLGRTVIAQIDSYGNILYLTTEVSEEAKKWFINKEDIYSEWLGE